jgi:cytochrome d ubiquinol oxidase subunit II
LWLPTVIGLIGLAVYTYYETDILTKIGVNPGVVPLIAPVAILTAGFFLRRKHEGWAFIMMGLTIMATLITLFMILFPRVMVSSLNPDWSLTIYTASSSPYTLTVMTIIALTFVPIVLGYQAWSYWVFRKRIEPHPETLTY